MRILITGSRSWVDEKEIESALKPLFDADSSTVLVSGACPTGADKLCEKYWRGRGGTVERHPADWGTYGKAAGFVRNRKMVDLGADYCFAFIKNGSSGATHTANSAIAEGIETRIVRA